MQKIVTMDGKRVKLGTHNDECMYNGHENTGPCQNRWLEMYAHRLKSAGKLADDAEPNPKDYVFYLAHYSQWQGENSYIQEITQEEAQEFCADHWDDMDHALNLLDESQFE